MDKGHKLIVFLLVFSLTAGGGLYTAFGDDDGHRGKRRYQKRERKHSEDNGRRNLPIFSDPAYTENCGTCHFAYQPGLLPAGSWEKIIAGLSDHFGETIELYSESAKAISAYLRANSANYSPRKLSLKIMKSLDNQLPLRITQVPFIRREHHEIPLSVLNRESIGSLSNCAACHTSADKGIYDDDNVTIPR
jgi:Dihaem cytochrome c